MTNLSETYPNCKVLTYRDVEELNDKNFENNWGFTLSELLRMIADHMDNRDSYALRREPTYTIEAIEYRLTDCNYHTLAKHLHDGNYNYALNWVYNEFVVNK